MRISAIGSNAVRTGRRDAGFTLVEILMVMLVVGLASSVVIASVPQRASVIEAEAERLATILRASADQAIMSGRSVGVDINAELGTYTVMVRRGRVWVPTRQTRRLPNDMLIEFRLADPVDAWPEDWPEMYVDPLGGVTPGQIVLERSRDRVRLDVSAAGDVRVEVADDF